MVDFGVNETFIRRPRIFVAFGMVISSTPTWELIYSSINRGSLWLLKILASVAVHVKSYLERSLTLLRLHITTLDISIISINVVKKQSLQPGTNKIAIAAIHRLIRTIYHLVIHNQNLLLSNC